MDGDVILASDSSDSEYEIADTHAVEYEGEYSEYGVGAKLLAEMGFTPGRGLGPREDGRRDIVLPDSTQNRRGLGDAIEIQPERHEEPSKVVQTGRQELETALEHVEAEIAACEEIKRALKLPAREIDLEDLYARFGSYWMSLPVDELAVAVEAEWIAEAVESRELLDRVYELRYLCDQDAIIRMFKALWLPKLREKLADWSEETSEWLFSTLLHVETRLPDFAWLPAEIELAVAETVPQLDIVQYLDDWWPVSSRAEQVAVAACSKILREFTPQHEGADSGSLNRWRELHPEIRQAIDDFTAQADESEEWRPVLGDEAFANMVAERQGERVVKLAGEGDPAFWSAFDAWATLASETPANRRMLDRLNAAFDNCHIEAPEVTPVPAQATFKDVVEAHCEEIGALLVRQPGVEARYRISRGTANLECYFDGDVLYVRQGSFKPVSVTELSNLLGRSN